MRLCESGIELDEEPLVVSAVVGQAAAHDDWELRRRTRALGHESGGSRQQYVEDCQVCCKPNVLTVRWDRSAAEYTIDAELES